jgi:hypothetical protein
VLAVQLAGPQRLGADESGVAAAVGDGAVFSQSASTWVRWATASRWRPRPSSARLYDTARVLYRICDAMGCIAWDGNLYEVPYEPSTRSARAPTPTSAASTSGRPDLPAAGLILLGLISCRRRPRRS